VVLLALAGLLAPLGAEVQRILWILGAIVLGISLFVPEKIP